MYIQALIKRKNNNDLVIKAERTENVKETSKTVVDYLFD